MIVAVVLAVAASVAYGVSDVVSGVVVRRHATAALALWSQVTGLVVLGTAAAWVRPTVALDVVGWGVAAGVVGALGVLAFYVGLQRGSTSVVAPIAGAGVILPVLAGLVMGEPVGWQVGIGIATAILGILVVSIADDGDGDRTDDRTDDGTDDDGHHPLPRGRTVPVDDGCVPRDLRRSTRSAVPFAVAAAIAFGSFFVLVDQATSVAPSGGGAMGTALVVALAVQVGALAATAVAATRHTRTCLRPTRALLVPATTVGVLDVGADLGVTLAVGLGPLAVVGPLSSLDPVVTVLIATVVLRERLRPAPLAGVVVALAGIVLVATG